MIHDKVAPLSALSAGVMSSPRNDPGSGDHRAGLPERGCCRIDCARSCARNLRACGACGVAPDRKTLWAGWKRPVTVDALEVPAPFPGRK